MKYCIIDEDKAKSYLPILRWYRDRTSIQRERKLLNSLVIKLSGVEGWKQLALSKPEFDLLTLVMKEFPEGSLIDKQLRLPGL